MKHLFNILLFAPLLLMGACNGNAGDGSFLETLSGKSPDSVKASLNEDFKTVWNSGDKLSIFFDECENELWSYSGADGAASGSFTHTSSVFRFDEVRKVAIYPYNADFVRTGNSVTGPMPVCGPFLGTATTSTTLQFHYLAAMVRVRFDREVSFKSARMTSVGGEVLGGTVALDASAEIPSINLVSPVSEIEAQDVSGKDIIFSVVPGTLSKGFTITFDYPDGRTQTVRYTDAITLAAGNVLDLNAFSSYNFVLTLNVSNGDVLSPKLATATADYRKDQTCKLTQDGEQYTFVFHPGYYEYPAGHEKAGQQEYGCRLTTNSYGLFLDASGNVTLENTGTKAKQITIGRDGSYIKLPVIAGKTVYGASILSGNNGGTNSWYIAKMDGDKFVKVSSSPMAQSLGDLSEVTVDFWSREDGGQFYIYFTGGNSLIPILNIYYL